MRTHRIPESPTQQTLKELQTILHSLPDHWTQLITTQTSTNNPATPITFNLVSPTTPLNIVKTRQFYTALIQDSDTEIPALQYWQRTLNPPVTFNATFWKSIYCPLLPNKHGEITWKITHRVLPTAYSLYKINVHPTMTCHHCTATETVDHLLLQCPELRPFWATVKGYIADISDKTITLTDQIALFGLQLKRSNKNNRSVIHLVNFVLHLARFAIHKSAVEHRLHNNEVPVKAIFNSMIKHYINLDYKLHKAKGTQYLFPFKWCINDVIVKIVNGRLQFPM